MATQPNNPKVDISGSITAGGVAQVLTAADKHMEGFEIQNISNGDLWFNEIGIPAVIGMGSFKLAPGAAYELPPNSKAVEGVSIIGAMTGQAYTARKW